MDNPAVGELVLLLDKIRASEDLVERAEVYFRDKSRQWSDGLAAYFEIYLERKREQIHYEKDRVDRMGRNIALGRNPNGPDI